MRIKKQIFVLLAWLFAISLVAQDIKISGVFEPKDMSAAAVYVLGNIGQNNILAEAKVVEGVFTVTLPSTTPKGIYKLAFGMQEKVYFYWLHEGISNYELTFKNKQNSWQMLSHTGIEHRFVSDYKEKELEQLETLRPLYSFLASYPEKESTLYKMVLKELNSKIKAFKQGSIGAQATAPPYSKEVIKQTALFLYEPTLSNEALEASFEQTFWDTVPINDSTYFKKPFFGDKLEQFFSGTIEDKALGEAEKYQKIKNKVLLSINKLAHHPQKNKYYNLMVRYFANVQYPYVISLIDSAIDSTKMITNEDVLYYQYRKNQGTLLGKTAPKIATATGEDFLNQRSSKQKILVFVGGNTPFSQQGLSQLYEKTKTQTNLQVYAVLLTDNPESMQNFKALFPSWLHHATTKEAIEPLAKDYFLLYTPTVFILEENNIVVKEQKLFEE